MRALWSSAYPNEPGAAARASADVDGAGARGSRAGSLIASLGLRRAPRAAPGEAERLNSAGQRQALALAAGVSATVWLALAVSLVLAARANGGVSAP